MSMNTTKLKSRLCFAARQLSEESRYWGGERRQELQRAARQAVAASATVNRTTERGLRSAEALLDAALDLVVRHAMARLDMEGDTPR